MLAETYYRKMAVHAIRMARLQCASPDELREMADTAGISYSELREIWAIGPLFARGDGPDILRLHTRLQAERAEEYDAEATRAEQAGDHDRAREYREAAQDARRMLIRTNARADAIELMEAEGGDDAEA